MAKNKNIDRRQFLKKAAGITVGAIGLPYIVPASALGRAGSVAPSDRIVMGCIGVGGQGTANLRAFINKSEVQVVAVCDVETESSLYNGGRTRGREPARQLVEEHYADQTRSGRSRGCAAYDDFQELLARSDIDAVSICTPDHWHALISVAAAKAGKDIYCEKPLANTIAEGRAVCEAVKRYGRVLQTGSHERSRDSVRFACELVRNGRLGELHTIRVNMPNDEPQHEKVRTTTAAQPPMPVPESLDWDRWLGHTPWVPYTPLRCHFWWRFIMNYGGGEMTDRGAHIIDLGQLGGGTDDTGPVEIIGRGMAPTAGLFNTFIEYQFECRYANGVRLLGSSKGPRGLRFEGSDGWIFIYIHGGRLEAEPKSLLRETVGTDEIHLGRSPGHHQDFLNAIKTRKQPVAPSEVGHRTGTICHLLNIAMLTGRELEWDPQQEQIINDPEANRMLSRPMRSPWHL
ncbi:MAG: Gfo/Idh/MocA family oxidoreductase [Fidelibacterota bacterium]|nr:MAG: Gfo/Idh/MocA family oxidoreductase [Candidatus Neomarinimicrobiota bacterium]